jgi:uncharacterized repeat protein (TIGR01451 family)
MSVSPAVADPGDTVTYRIEVTNPNGVDAPLDDIEALLPTLVYTPGTSAVDGSAIDDPDSGTVAFLVWDTPMTVLAHATSTLSFDLVVPGPTGCDRCLATIDPGDYTSEAWASSPVADVTPTGPTAPLTIRAQTELLASPAVAHKLSVTAPVLHAQLIDLFASAPLGGEPVTFTVNGAVVCTAQTDPDGFASCVLGPVQLLEVLAADGYDAAFAGDLRYGRSTSHASLVQENA